MAALLILGSHNYGYPGLCLTIMKLPFYRDQWKQTIAGVNNQLSKLFFGVALNSSSWMFALVDLESAGLCPECPSSDPTS